MILRSLLLSLLITTTAAAQSSVPATVYLKNGREFQGIVASVSRDQIQLKLEQDSAGLVGFQHREISHVDFSPNLEWSDAMQAFGQRDYQEAALKFEAIAKKRNASTFYPAIGNFSTLADRRLLDCYRRLMEPEKIPPVVERMEWGKLPPFERSASDVANVWAAVGSKDWESAITAADDALQKTRPGSADANEISYLRGLAYDEKGEDEAAVLAFGSVIGPYPGTNRRTASDAIRRSAAILAKNPERKSELQALVHIYARSFGNGKLWPEATPEMKQLLAEAIKPAG